LNVSTRPDVWFSNRAFSDCKFRRIQVKILHRKDRRASGVAIKKDLPKSALESSQTIWLDPFSQTLTETKTGARKMLQNPARDR
jgi:hypothetical protein